MVEFVVLNELSLPVGSDNSNAQKNLINMIQLLNILKEKHIETIRVITDIKNLEITKELKLYEYIPNIIDKDFKTRMISLISNKIINIKNPLITQNEIDENEFDIIEYKYKTKTSIGLGVADVFETFSISFSNDKEWEQNYLEVEKSNLDSNGDILTLKTKVKNLSKAEIPIEFNEYLKKIFEFRFNVLQKEFWNIKETCFSKIKFCDEVKEQIEKLDGEVYKSFLEKIILLEIDIKKITDWNYSGESESVKNNPDLKKLREFSHSDFGKKYFDFHIKSFPRGYRMYFWENENDIYIGYIGIHLKTKNH